MTSTTTGSTRPARCPDPARRSDRPGPSRRERCHRKQGHRRPGHRRPGHLTPGCPQRCRHKPDRRRTCQCAQCRPDRWPLDPCQLDRFHLVRFHLDRCPLARCRRTRWPTNRCHGTPTSPGGTRPRRRRTRRRGPIHPPEPVDRSRPIPAARDTDTAGRSVWPAARRLDSPRRRRICRSCRVRAGTTDESALARPTDRNLSDRESRPDQRP